MFMRQHWGPCAVLITLASLSSMALAEEARVGRYQSARPTPTDEQRAPLEAVTAVRFPGQVVTVGHAMDHLLPRTGFALAGNTASDPAQRILLSRPLPDVHRELGPLTIRRMLEVLAGPAWTLVVDPVHRLVAFELQPAYRAQWENTMAVPEVAESTHAPSGPRASTRQADSDRPDGIRERVHVTPGTTVSAMARWFSDDDDATPFQWMHAIFNANRDRFGRIAGQRNMNRLAVGTVLHIPEAPSFMPDREARARVLNQYRQWQAAQYPVHPGVPAGQADTPAGR